MTVPRDTSDWATLGFPEGTTMLRLAACYPARCIVVLACRRSDPDRSDRIYVRGSTRRTYREVPWPEGTNSFEEPLISHCAEELFVLGQVWRDVETADGSPRIPPIRGGDVTGLYRLQLPHGAPELVHSGRGPEVPSDAEAGVRDGWVLSQLLGLMPDGRRIIVKVSMPSLNAHTTVWNYHVAVLDPATSELDALATLPGVFA